MRRTLTRKLTILNSEWLVVSQRLKMEGILVRILDLMVRGEGLEPSRLRIRPSNVRVYQFHHPRAQTNRDREGIPF